MTILVRVDPVLYINSVSHEQTIIKIRDTMCTLIVDKTVVKMYKSNRYSTIFYSMSYKLYEDIIQCFYTYFKHNDLQ